MTTYNVGDRVRVRSDLREQRYGYNSAVPDMLHLAGETVTIVAISGSNYTIAEDERRWGWTDEMMVGIAGTNPRGESNMRLVAIDGLDGVPFLIYRDSDGSYKGTVPGGGMVRLGTDAMNDYPSAFSFERPWHSAIPLSLDQAHVLQDAIHGEGIRYFGTSVHLPAIRGGREESGGLLSFTRTRGARQQDEQEIPPGLIREILVHLGDTSSEIPRSVLPDKFVINMGRQPLTREVLDKLYALVPDSEDRHLERDYIGSTWDYLYYEGAVLAGTDNPLSRRSDWPQYQLSDVLQLSELVGDTPPKKRPARTPELVGQIARGSTLDLRPLIRCGFELETQDTEGVTDGERDLDEWLDEKTQEEIDNAGSHQQAEWMESYGPRSCKRLSSSALSEIIDDIGFGSGLDSVLVGFDFADFESELFDNLRDEIRDNRWDYGWDDDDDEDRIDYGHFRRNSSRFLEAGYDSTVSGCELRTVGALTYGEFRRAAAEVFGKWTHEIDTECSFHIHLSVEGIRPKGTVLAQSMTHYILDHQAELPPAIRKRFQNHSNMREYACPSSSPNGKYSFVHRCDRHKTYEFRCFGNVSTFRDAVACQDMAIRALHHAYEQLAGLTPKYEDLDSARWKDAAQESRRTGRPLTELMTEGVS